LPRRCGPVTVARVGQRVRSRSGVVSSTNILLTRFHGAEAVGEVIDFMVPETSSTRKARDLLVRQARAMRSRSARPARRSATSRRPSPTWP
ncbi:MAG TPA: hypothetical protein VF933_35560, partial [Streptosporangiaceae bacterium]